MKLEHKGMQNPKKLVIVVGMLLLLFTFCLSFIPRSPIAAATPTPTEKGKKCKYYYKVQPGDTITYIGQLYQIDWREIAKANNLKEPYVLTPGDKLCIPGGVAPEITESETGDATITAKTEPTGSVVGGMGNVYLKLEHFPKNKSYNVIIRPNTTYVSYRLNCMLLEFPTDMHRKDELHCNPIHTDEKGFFEGWFRIPTTIPNAPIHELCIKDVWTDETQCTNFDDPEYYFEKFAYATHKYGR